ncbi:hypothetical protein [Micromonospora sp. NPDC005305]|uniref:hypothetical protein n=1 Tax=Micromonospora sp. NPDC005305 TaxID=3156875 RepID=UPI0033AAFEE5
MGHVFVRLAGHGTRLVPYWPYRFTGSAGSSTVQVTVVGDGGERRAVVAPGAASVPGVVDVDAGPDGDWRLEMGPFSLWWPAGFAVESPTEPGDGTPCYLLGPDQAMIFPQGPVPLARLAGPDALVAPGQRVVHRRVLEDDIDVVELAYARRRRLVAGALDHPGRARPRAGPHRTGPGGGRRGGPDRRRPDGRHRDRRPPP